MPTSYPHDAPKVKCLTKVRPRNAAPAQGPWPQPDEALAQVYHPNIDLDGNVCLNILREDWKPVLSISSIIYGLQFLFLVRLSLAQRSKCQAAHRPRSRSPPPQLRGPEQRLS